MSYINPTPDLDENNIIDTVDYETDYVQLNKVYFAFIDVLGFKKTFDDMKISQKNEDAEKYRDVFNYYFSLMNAADFMTSGKHTGCYAGQTSDSLYFYTNRTDYLMQFIKIFSHFSLYAMSKNVFFRGGIAKGVLYQKEQYQFYGDSVIGAYLLENNISKNPIIIVDEKTNKDMEAVVGYKGIVTVSKDGMRHYIKPFNSLKQGDAIALDIDANFKIRDIDEIAKKNYIKRNKELF